MSPRRSIVPFVTLAAFVALGLVGILRHEMWRDELEIWLIARDSGSLAQLFHNMRFEAHPALWYLVNYGLSRLTAEPLAMQLTNLCIGTAAVALFLWCAPFALALRVLFCFGYLAAYEFTIISRSYGLELLLVLGCCALWPQRRRRLPWLALLLFLLANTNLYGSIIAAALGLLLGIDIARADDAEPRPATAMLLVAAALIVGGIAIATGDVWLQHRRIGPSHTFFPELGEARWYAESLATVAAGYLPLPKFGEPSFWNTSVLELLPRVLRPWVGAALGAALLGLSAACLMRRGRVLLVFALAVAAMLCVTVFFWRGQLRQHLQPFLWFVVCAWLARARCARADHGRLLPGLLLVLFAVHAVAWAHAFRLDYARPFSNAKAAAAALRGSDLAGATFIGSIDYAVQGLAAFGVGPIYYPESGRFGTFVYWGVERRPLVEPQDVLAAARRLLREHEPPLVLITSYAIFSYAEPVEFLAAPDVRVRLIGHFEGAIVPTEDFHLYRLDRPSVDSRVEGAR